MTITISYFNMIKSLKLITKNPVNKQSISSDNGLAPDS